MTLKGDAKFKKKLNRGLKNDKKGLVNFHASIQKSENFQMNIQMKKYRRVMFLGTEEYCDV